MLLPGQLVIQLLYALSLPLSANKAVGAASRQSDISQFYVDADGKNATLNDPANFSLGLVIHFADTSAVAVGSPRLKAEARLRAGLNQARPDGSSHQGSWVLHHPDPFLPDKSSA